jgi:hypothetical protein
MGTEKYAFGARVLNISVPIFLSFVSSVVEMVRLFLQDCSPLVPYGNYFRRVSSKLLRIRSHDRPVSDLLFKKATEGQCSTFNGGVRGF